MKKTPSIFRLASRLYWSEEEQRGLFAAGGGGAECSKILEEALQAVACAERHS